MTRRVAQAILQAMSGPDEGWRERDPSEPKSFGPISDAHWSKKRAGSNRDAIEYMRDRSHAPGVADGGGARNVYCMGCQGVIPFDGSRKPEVCPHCGVALDEHVQAMFNWVEIDDAPTGDFAALVRVAAIGLAVLTALGVLAWWILR